MIYFGLFKGNLKDLHEILGLGFIAAVIFHLFYNWKQMKKYFNKNAFLSSVLITALITGGFVINSLYKEPSPKGVVIQSMMNTSIVNALNVLNIEYNDAVRILNQHHIDIKKNDSLKTIAKKANMSPYEIIGMLNKP